MCNIVPVLMVEQNSGKRFKATPLSTCNMENEWKMLKFTGFPEVIFQSGAVVLKNSENFIFRNKMRLSEPQQCSTR